MRIIPSIIAFLVLTNNCFGQQPAHFVWGQEELAGVDIYNILQDNVGDYWFATNQGIYNYDGRKMISIPLEKSKSTSVFNLVENSSGDIYCNNFSGQIFKVNKSLCDLYFELPDSLISPYLNIQFDDRDNLLVFAKHLFKLLPDKQIKIIYRFDNGQYQDVLRADDGSLYFHPWIKEYYFKWKNNNLDKQEVQGLFSKDKMRQILTFIEVENKLFCYDTCEVFHVNKGQLIPTGIKKDNSEPAKFTTLADQLWLLKSTMGVRRFDLDKSDERGKLLFESDFISASLEDREGNLLLGTFGSGIIFLPANAALDYSFPVNERIEDLTLGENGKVYLGTLSGKVYSLNNNGELNLVIDGLKKSVEFLEWLPKQNQLCVGEFDVKIYKPNTKDFNNCFHSSIKDLFFVDDNSFLIATNKEVALIYNEDNQWKNSARLKLTNGSELDLTKLNKRTYSVVFDSTENAIYTATNKGVNYLSIKDGLQEIKYNNATISATSLLKWKGKVFANMKGVGVLVIVNGIVEDVWESINPIYQIESNQNNIVFSTDRGLVMFDEFGNKVGSFGVSDGLYSDKINDFIVGENDIWVAHLKGLQKIGIGNVSKLHYKPKVTVKNLLVNGVLTDVLKQNYLSTENKFQFSLYSDSKRNKSEITYMYQMEGIDVKWQSTPYLDNTIDYKSLPPGNYTFKAKAVFRGEESDVILVPFNIANPYYKEGWFYILLFVVSTGIVALLFRFQLKRQKKKAAQLNELNASKLTAIQSQMNPHFIFNALNSIQDLVLKGDVDNSYIYITKFANLVRRTLNYSDKDFIDFDSEIKLIELYLTLEKLRFKKEFNYEIITNGIDDLLVPPMLVQPFIENALVHGLLHKEGKKEIEIEFRLEEELVCLITDNGIGRTKALEIKERQRSDHESFSVNAIKKRFEILEEHFGGSLGFEYEDLESNGEALGTRVILRIPIKRVL